MSEFYCEVVKLGKVGKHPNADTLSITQVLGYPVIFRTEDFKMHDLAVYIPVDAIVPDTEEWAFLQGHRRIKAKRLRGIYSQGMLVALRCTCGAESERRRKHDEGCLIDASVGQSALQALGITKWEPPIDTHMGGEMEHFSGLAPIYDIEGLPRYKHLLEPGIEVSVTEKIHGCNARFIYKDGRLWCGSRNNWWKESESNLWWNAARQHNLEEKLANYPDHIFYGEVFGQVQDLKYGAKNGQFFVRFFDIFHPSSGTWHDHPAFVQACSLVKVETVPSLYLGPWDPEQLIALCEGESTLAKHVREGFVVKPTKEIHTLEIGRLILKQVGTGYHLRKEKP